MREAIAAIAPGALAWLVIALLLRAGWAQHLSDHPNERSLHSQPTPRIGGVGMLAGVFPAAWLCASGPAGRGPGVCAAPLVRVVRRRCAQPARAGAACGARVGGARRARRDRGNAYIGAGHACLGPRRFRDRVGHQPLQLHGWCRRPCGRHGAVGLYLLRDRGMGCGRAHTRVPVARDRGGERRFPGPQLPARAHLPRRFGIGLDRLPRRRAWRIRRGGAGLVAGLPAPGVLAVRGRCHRHFAAAHGTPRGASGGAHRSHFYQRLVLAGWPRCAACWRERTR